jgi:uncharacterized protein (TIGR02118 family)
MSGMIRFIVLYDPPADADAFDRHYREVHIPLVRKLPGLIGYTISKGMIPVQGNRPCHLVAELDFPDMTALQGAFGSPAGQAAAADVAEMAGEGVHSMIFEVEEA